MLKTLMVAARDRARLAEITTVARRYGLDIVLAFIGSSSEPLLQDNKADSLPRRVRKALEELGPTYVKLGQIMATRADLLPEEWITELEQLHSQAPILPFAELEVGLEKALGQSIDEAFASFERKPLAAASMAQVHRATLPDGREVVVKIRRPDIRRVIEADLRLLEQIAVIAENRSAEARRFMPRAMVRQLSEAILQELDFVNEGRNADLLRADFAQDPRVVIPEIHWLWTSETILVMDFIEGIPPRNAEVLSAQGIDPQCIADLCGDLMLDMTLINGRFHADPHPGNLLCLRDNRIALLDMGMLGHVSPRRKDEFFGFIQSLLTGDPASLAEVLAVWSAGADVPRENIQRAAEKLTQRHGQRRLILAQMVNDFFPLIREEGLHMPPDLLLLFKALMTIDGVLTTIQPDFDLGAAMRRSWPRLISAKFAPSSWSSSAQALALELHRIGEDSPRLIRALVKKLEQPTQNGHSIDNSEAIRQAGRWIAGGMVVSALIVSVMPSVL